MSVAACLLFYATVLTWLCPPLLRRLTSRGIAPRLGVVVWLTAIGTALVAWVGALGAAVAALAFSGGTTVRCLEVLGFPHNATLLGRVPVALMATAALAATISVLHRTIRIARKLSSDSEEHAHAARIIGTPTERDDVVVISAHRPAAYCVAGRPHAIVITSAAVQSLGGRHLAAVLAHEDAHLRGRHHQLLMVLRALATPLSWLPLFTAGASEMARLLEMCADDVAARRHGAALLVESLRRLSGIPAAPALGAADTAVVARVARLARRAGAGQRWGNRLALILVMVTAAATPLTAALVCLH